MNIITMTGHTGAHSQKEATLSNELNNREEQDFRKILQFVG